MLPRDETVVSIIEIIRTLPQGYKLEDLYHYRDQVLKAVNNAKGEWIGWQTGVSPYPKLNYFAPDEQIDLPLNQIDCIYYDGFPRYWRKDWIRECLENWKERLPAARFLPLDLVPPDERSYILPPTAMSQTTRPGGQSNRAKLLSNAFTEFYEKDQSYVFEVLSRTQNTNPLSRRPDSYADLTLTSSTPSVSILMSIYNMKDTIGWTIRSVLAQTYQNWELWIGDDASNDDSLLEMLSPSDTRIKVLQEPHNIGKARMMNKLLQRAEGEFILELDGDDWIPPTAVEHLVQILEQSPSAGIATGSYGCWFRSRQMGCSWKGVVNPNDIAKTDWLAQRHPPVPRMYRKSALEDIGGWLNHAEDWNRVFEDIEVTSRLLKRYTAVSSPEILYHRVIHQDSISQRNRERFPSWSKIILNRR